MTPARREPKEPETLLPLTPATFHILLVLADEERHGYAIMLEIEQQTERALRMGPGTLYGSLKRLLSGGLIEESDEQRAGPGLSDGRRRYYRITPFGRAVARAEARRMALMVRLAQRARLIGPEPA